jgi:Putative zinc binding domain
MILDLGVQPLANNLLRAEDLGKVEPKFPLRLFVCVDCWLVQIPDIVPPAQLFTDYVYFSSFSDTMVAHARQSAERYIQQFELGPESLVIEVASNDGYMLQFFLRAGVPCLGIEPAANIARAAQQKGIPTMVEFFGNHCGRELASSMRQADLILGNNVLAHMAELSSSFPMHSICWRKRSSTPFTTSTYSTSRSQHCSPSSRNMAFVSMTSSVCLSMEDLSASSPAWHPDRQRLRLLTLS